MKRLPIPADQMRVRRIELALGAATESVLELSQVMFSLPTPLYHRAQFRNMVLSKEIIERRLEVMARELDKLKKIVDNAPR